MFQNKSGNNAWKVTGRNFIQINYYDNGREQIRG